MAGRRKRWATLEERLGPTESGGAGQGKAAEGGPALGGACAPAAAARRRGLGGGERVGAGGRRRPLVSGCEPGASCRLGRGAFSPRPSPRRAFSSIPFASSPPPSVLPARARAAAQPAGPLARAFRAGQRGPVPRPFPGHGGRRQHSLAAGRARGWAARTLAASRGA